MNSRVRLFFAKMAPRSLEDEIPLLKSDKLSPTMKSHFQEQITSCQKIAKDGRPSDKVPNAIAVLAFLKRPDYINKWHYKVVYFQRGHQVELEDQVSQNVCPPIVW